MAEFFLHRGHRLVTDATRNEQIEVAEVGVHVQRESVRRNAARNVHADGGDLALQVSTLSLQKREGQGWGTLAFRTRYRPRAGQTRHPAGGYTKIGAGADQHF